MRRRFIYVKDDKGELQLTEVGLDYVGESRSTATDSVLWNDRAYQDMGDPRFTSRTQHQQFMKDRGLTVASDYRQEWRSRDEQRVKARNGYDPTRKRDIVEAIHKLRSR